MEENKEEQDLSMDGIINMTPDQLESDLHITVEPDEEGNVNFSEEQLAEMFQMAEQREQMKNPYTHQLNFDNIKTLEDVIAILHSFDINIDPRQWSQDEKYIKPKGE
jgi:hypothetical protein